jgi:hypothetical protein
VLRIFGRNRRAASFRILWSCAGQLRRSALGANPPGSRSWHIVEFVLLAHFKQRGTIRTRWIKELAQFAPAHLDCRLRRHLRSDG